ncbi:MAG: citrate synthase [Gemmatimonadetes bacterium]|nr:citrate synthase [Gemmatimonadota bacterium]
MEAEAGAEKSPTLRMRDDRTGREYASQILEGDVVRAMDLRRIRVEDSDFGMMSYDPSFSNTASTRSAVTYVDGGKGVLRHRGYPIDQLAERSSFLEVSFLILNGELPTADELEAFEKTVAAEYALPAHMDGLFDSFPHAASPMAMVMTGVSALAAVSPEARDVTDPEARRRETVKLIAKMPTLAAHAFRRSLGEPYLAPVGGSYAGNFLHMLFDSDDGERDPNPVFEKALDLLFVLHADHEQNCSTTAMRVIGSSHADPYSALAGAIGALSGPLHGGANEAVLRMLRRIGTVDRIPEFLDGVKDKRERLMGFGHRVYRAYDPRASIIKRAADEVFQVAGRNPLLDVAVELERIALDEDYFISRNLYPNVDFYSGLIYQAIGLPMGMFPVLFAVPRTVGWLTQWDEMLRDPEQRIARPRQVYVGHDERPYVGVDARE